MQNSQGAEGALYGCLEHNLLSENVRFFYLLFSSSPSTLPFQLPFLGFFRTP